RRRPRADYNDLDRPCRGRHAIAGSAMSTVQDSQAYESAYSESRFWRKARHSAAAAGRQVLEKALWLYYGAQSPDTPKWARRVIYGALGYFVLPLDAIPDLAPLVGYTDDLGVMAAALGVVAMHIDASVREQARR